MNDAEEIFTHPWLDKMKIDELFTKKVFLQQKYAVNFHEIQLEAPFKPKTSADLILSTADEETSKESEQIKSLH